VEDNFGVVSWVVFGALVGYVASRVFGIHGRLGWVGLVVVGIVGAYLGGFLLGRVTGREVSVGWDPASLAAAVVGAVLLLAVISPFGLRDDAGHVLVPPTRWWERIRVPRRQDGTGGERGPE
jgi:uncharacterized membrane protein YeaQ/YmgE (transglycosylase-associated protein family)